MSGWTRVSTLAAVLGRILLLSAPASAQREQGGGGVETSLLAGLVRYDLDRSGTGFGAKADLSFRPTSGLIIEPGLGFLTYRNQFGQRNNWLFPELSALVEVRVGAMRPFLGGGGGASVAERVGPDRYEATLHGMAGVRFRLGRSWGGRVEVRVRAVPPWRGHTADFELGVVRGMFR